jgi:hypothetical protein
MIGPKRTLGQSARTDLQAVSLMPFRDGGRAPMATENARAELNPPDRQIQILPNRSELVLILKCGNQDLARRSVGLLNARASDRDQIVMPKSAPAIFSGDIGDVASVWRRRAAKEFIIAGGVGKSQNRAHCGSTEHRDHRDNRHPNAMGSLHLRVLSESPWKANWSAVGETAP